MLNLLVLLFGFFFFLVVYFVPVIIAKYRGVKHFGSIVVIDLFLGMTFVGWVIALAMACSDSLKKEPETGQSSF